MRQSILASQAECVCDSSEPARRTSCGSRALLYPQATLASRAPLANALARTATWRATAASNTGGSSKIAFCWRGFRPACRAISSFAPARAAA